MHLKVSEALIYLFLVHLFDYVQPVSDNIAIFLSYSDEYR